MPRLLPAAPRHCRTRRSRVAVAAGEEQLGNCSAEQSKYYRFHLNSGKVDLSAMYLQRVRVVDKGFAAALAHVSTVVTPPLPAAQNLGLGLRRLCRGQTFSKRRAARHMYSGAEYELPALSVK
jgi:hypothetical protein